MNWLETFKAVGLEYQIVLNIQQATYVLQKRCRVSSIENINLLKPSGNFTYHQV
jgi:hypothetical protein